MICLSEVVCCFLGIIRLLPYQIAIQQTAIKFEFAVNILQTRDKRRDMI